MAAYVIVDLDIKDPEGFAKYPPQVISQIEKHGGKVLIRCSKLEVMEGSWQPKRVVIIEFPSKQDAKNFYEAEEYRPLKDLRLRTASSNLVLGEGE